MATQWHPVRVSAETKQRLDLYRESLAKHDVTIVTGNSARWDCYPSYDAIIAHLMDQVEEHRSRARKSRKKRSQAKRVDRATPRDETF